MYVFFPSRLLCIRIKSKDMNSGDKYIRSIMAVTVCLWTFNFWDNIQMEGQLLNKTLGTSMVE